MLGVDLNLLNVSIQFISLALNGKLLEQLHASSYFLYNLATFFFSLDSFLPAENIHKNSVSHTYSSPYSDEKSFQSS